MEDSSTAAASRESTREGLVGWEPQAVSWGLADRVVPLSLPGGSRLGADYGDRPDDVRLHLSASRFGVTLTKGRDDALVVIVAV
jgi:hypothetical protein